MTKSSSLSLGGSTWLGRRGDSQTLGYASSRTLHSSFSGVARSSVVRYARASMSTRMGGAPHALSVVRRIQSFSNLSCETKASRHCRHRSASPQDPVESEGLLPPECLAGSRPVLSAKYLQMKSKTWSSCAERFSEPRMSTISFSASCSRPRSPGGTEYDPKFRATQPLAAAAILPRCSVRGSCRTSCRKETARILIFSLILARLLSKRTCMPRTSATAKSSTSWVSSTSQLPS
mmetsp:Transcript_28372/g.80155  ORF Transcript_28372/g.80155 Transcript_28372/m.80155 type:complete len:234 (+) Transcript_28372:511-1212(+)